MGNIISLDRKLLISKEKKTAIVRRRKILAVQKVFQCTQCALKCEKCGMQISETPGQGYRERHRTRIPYRFCESCYEEYLEYIERLRGKEMPDSYWYNEEWLRVWRSWIDYQGAINRYMKSKEFRQLLNELKQTGPDG